MAWHMMYPKGQAPEMEEISRYVASPLWDELNAFIQERYKASPLVSHSSCSMAPGYNVKYRKGGKALCTLYPKDGSFDCLIVIGAKQALAAEALLDSFDPHIITLYQKADAANNMRWLNISVTTLRILENVKTLIHLRATCR